MTWQLRERDCPICGPNVPANEFSAAHVDTDQLDAFAFASRKVPECMHWRLLECQKCRLLYASPAPQLGDLATLYRDADYDSNSEARFAATTYRQLIARLTVNESQRGTALDIGAGDGAFLHELLQLGYQRVVGIEPSSAPIAAAPPHVRPYLRQELFLPGLFDSDQFDLVTCFQTIEHVDDPLGLAREVLRILKPNGLMVLVGHNRNAWTAKVLGARCPIFDVEHLQLFNPTSICSLVSSAGFGDVRSGTIWNRYPLSYWMRLAPIPQFVARPVHSLLRGCRLIDLPLSVPVGNQFVAGRREL